MSDSLVTSSSFQNCEEHCAVLYNCNGNSDGTSYVNIDPSALENVPSHLEVSVSAVLGYCKIKVLLPFFRLLAMLGWRPLCYDSQQDGHETLCFLSCLYSILVVLLMLSGYILPYAACFRRDGFPLYQNEIGVPSFEKAPYNSSQVMHMTDEVGQPVHCSGGVFSVYVFPDIVHLLAYICTLYLMRVAEHEQLETLMERVFLQMSVFQTWFVAQRKMIRKLRWLMALGIFWVVVSFLSQVLQVADQKINFRWFQTNVDAVHMFLLFLMLISVTWNDIICVAIATSYSVHCQLIISYLQNLRRSVIEKTLSFQCFYKELQEARKFLNFLNNEQAIGISLLALNFGCKATTGVYGLVTESSEPYRSTYITASIYLIVFLWIGLLLYPCIQAVMLTECCSNIRKLGHELRARPFGYQDIPQADLDSFLLYTSTLTMQARIFRIPVQASCLFLAFVCIVFTMVFLGQLGMVKME